MILTFRLNEGGTRKQQLRVLLKVSPGIQPVHPEKARPRLGFEVFIFGVVWKNIAVEGLFINGYERSRIVLEYDLLAHFTTGRNSLTS